VGGLVLLALVAAGGAWWWLRPKKPDMIAVLQANNRGVGLMDQYDYEKAADAFQEVVTMAPDWVPGKINLGIAIMNRDKGKGTAAPQIFREILAQEPDNLYAHFCLGILMYFKGKPGDWAETTRHFEKVTQGDPADGHAWYWLGASLHEDRKRATACMKRAIRLNPQLAGAHYQLRSLLGYDPEGANKAFEEFELLRNHGDETEPYGNIVGMKYSEMGRYAEVIGHQAIPPGPARTGPLPLFHRDAHCRVRLAKGTRWAKRADLLEEPDAKIGKLRARVRDRFGAVMVVLDYNNDGKPDLFLVGAVVRKGRVGDLLLRNDGGGTFTDVTARAGLAGPRPSLGCCVADYNNDGYPDLLITGAGEQHLFRNDRKGHFEDVSTLAELDRLKTVCLGAAFLDLDQDGDLDLVIAQYTSLAAADAALRGRG
jgi:hypothetical protein